MTSLWCSDCHEVRDFEPVPDCAEAECSCVGCGAALVFSGVDHSAEPSYAAVA